MPFAVNQGINIHYELEGSGTPLVLVHQLSGSLEDWRSTGYTQALGQDRRLVLIDARGHGLSDGPHAGEDYLPERLAGDVQAVLDELGIGRAHYLGYSMGAMIGCVLLQTAPERLCSLMLGGIDFWAQPTEAESQKAAMGRAMLVRATAVGGGRAAVERMEQSGAPAPAPVKAMLLRNDTAALVAAIDGMLAWRGVADLLPRVTTPCLVWAGAADAMHDRVQGGAGQIPGATFVSLEGLDHEQAAARSDLVLPHIRRFLAGVDVTAL